MSHRFGKIAFAASSVATGATLLALALGGGADARHTAPEVLRAAQSTLSGTKVIHARIVADGKTLPEEEWLDEATGRTRRVEHGTARAGDLVSIQDSAGVHSWDTHHYGPVFEALTSDPADPWLTSSEPLLLRFKHALARGNATVIGHDVVRGRKVAIVRMGAAAAAGAEVTSPIEAALDEETLLPLSMSGNAHGKPWKVDVFPEELAADAVPVDTFATPPLGRFFIRQRRLHPAELASVPNFDAYWLGPANQGLQVGALGYDEREDPQAPFPLEPRLYVSYVRGPDPYAPAAIELEERGAEGKQARLEYATYETQGSASSVPILGQDRPVFLISGEGDVSFGFLVNKTLISGHSQLSAGALQDALAKLRSAR
jgi:hypothetical protein